MSAVWKEISQFHPLPKSFYEKQQGLGSSSKSNSSKPTAAGGWSRGRRLGSRSTAPLSQPQQQYSLSSSGIRIPNRKKLSQLIQCLAISETQKMHLENQISEISREKQELSSKLEAALQTKEDILREQKNSQSALMEKSSILASKTKEIENLREKLREMEDLTKSRIANDVTDSQQAIASPIMIALEDRLNDIQNDIKTIHTKISKKDRDTATTASNTNGVALSLPDETSGLSQLSSMVDLGSKTNDDLPSLEFLLKKILKSRKVHYKEEIDNAPNSAPIASSTILTADQKQESEQKSHNNSKNIPSSVTPVSSLSQYPESETRPHRHLSPLRSQRNPVVIVDETTSKNAATSPPTQSYISRLERDRKPSYRRKKAAKSRSSSSVLHSRHHHNVSSCACATCAKNLSWICPECFHSDYSNTSHTHESSFLDKQLGGVSAGTKKDGTETFMKISDRRNQDASVLFSNDTSMIRPLADIVSDMDLNGAQGSFAIANELEADGELLELSGLVYGNAEKIIISKLDFDSKETKFLNPSIDLVLSLPSDESPSFLSHLFSKYLNMTHLPTYRHQYYQLFSEQFKGGEAGRVASMKPIYAKIDESSFMSWNSVEVRICWSAKDPLDFTLSLCKQCLNDKVVRIQPRWTGQPIKTQLPQNVSATISIILEPVVAGVIPVTVIIPVTIIIILISIAWRLFIPMMEKYFA